ncbi:MAG: hypothetical protein HY915_02495 [Desulfovibrio sp.]|nr:hypothetical protein [Desulfovibrio sp.]
MRILALLTSLMLFSAGAFAADEAADKANRAKFEKDCAALIAAGGPCADVPTGGGGRRGCVAKPENLAKASPECKKTIEEWKALPK